ncbi:envelope stress response membrane protein PspB [Pseudidiomarina insulisalsae]|uniref:Envelope stress response membrane protein PspB n=1 Tax=Pseudidiomarina insulisalsae TaxID=575789 RepID=A0A432YA48_9GAMM|nr:envelope stress response membrane protein PspB [Pseudidiomarina insulisalsae]RUO57848.1 envelope stress response membrane protein PspB [Pseudidiomarina insulisalsae]
MADVLEMMIAVPLILFMIFVAPIWVIMHYRSKRKISQGLSQEEIQNLQHLAQQAEQMRERIKTLESILDADAPTWRDRK